MITEISTGPDGELVTLSQVKLDLGITGFTEDAFLRVLLNGASAVVQAHCGRSFAMESVEETFRDIECNAVTLARYPIISVDTVRENGVELAPADIDCDFASGLIYRLSNNRRSAWCTPLLVIEYYSGYESVPDVVKRATLNLTRLMYAQANRDPTLRSLELPDVATESFWSGAVPGEPGAALPADIAAMLSRFVVRRLAAA